MQWRADSFPWSQKIQSVSSRAQSCTHELMHLRPSLSVARSTRVNVGPFLHHLISLDLSPPRQTILSITSPVHLPSPLSLSLSLSPIKSIPSILKPNLPNIQLCKTYPYMAVAKTGFDLQSHPISLPTSWHLYTITPCHHQTSTQGPRQQAQCKIQWTERFWPREITVRQRSAVVRGSNPILIGCELSLLVIQRLF